MAMTHKDALNLAMVVDDVGYEPLRITLQDNNPSTTNYTKNVFILFGTKRL